MVLAPKYEKQREKKFDEFYDSNLDRFIAQHPGEVVVLEEGSSGIKARFYDTPAEANAYLTKKMKGGYCGPASYVKRVPKKKK